MLRVVRVSGLALRCLIGVLACGRPVRLREGCLRGLSRRRRRPQSHYREIGGRYVKTCLQYEGRERLHM